MNLKEKITNLEKNKLDLPLINLPNYNFILRNENSNYYIKCIIRNKFVRLTPEEWIRQHFLKYLITEYNYPKGLISLEEKIKIGNVKKRSDAIVYNKDLSPFMLIEFKNEKIKLTNDVINQIGVYNLNVKAPYIVITNGINLIIFKINFDTKEIKLLNDIPIFKKV
jgi:hypothetical protein